MYPDSKFLPFLSASSPSEAKHPKPPLSQIDLKSKTTHSRKLSAKDERPTAIKHGGLVIDKDPQTRD